MPESWTAIVRRPDRAESGPVRLIGDRPEHDAGKRDMRRSFARQRDPLAVCNHVHQRVSPHIAPTNARRLLSFDESANDMVQDLGTGSALPDKEGFRGKVAPYEMLRARQRMTPRQRDHQGFRP